jgi:hypothetical protein
MKVFSLIKYLVLLYWVLIIDKRLLIFSQSAIVLQRTDHEFLKAPAVGQLLADRFRYRSAECLDLIFRHNKEATVAEEIILCNDTSLLALLVIRVLDKNIFIRVVLQGPVNSCKLLHDHTFHARSPALCFY